MEHPEAPEGLGAQLVHVLRHLDAVRRPTVDSLRLIAEGTLPAYRLPGRAGRWVEPDRLEGDLSAAASVCRPKPTAGGRGSAAEPAAGDDAGPSPNPEEDPMPRSPQGTRNPWRLELL